MTLHERMDAALPACRGALERYRKSTQTRQIVYCMHDCPDIPDLQKRFGLSYYAITALMGTLDFRERLREWKPQPTWKDRPTTDTSAVPLSVLRRGQRRYRRPAYYAQV